jgi:hypothetical protein
MARLLVVMRRDSLEVQARGKYFFLGIRRRPWLTVAVALPSTGIEEAPYIAGPTW